MLRLTIVFSASGCLTCRTRKVRVNREAVIQALEHRCSRLNQVKCDERAGTCLNCERILLACKWPPVRDVVDEHDDSAESAATAQQDDERADSSS